MFSGYLRFLDTLASVVDSQKAVTALRFHGTMDVDARDKVQKQFNSSNQGFQLLLTDSTGDMSLNIIQALIVIQTETGWNANFERQAWTKKFQQG